MCLLVPVCLSLPLSASLCQHLQCCHSLWSVYVCLCLSVSVSVCLSVCLSLRPHPPLSVLNKCMLVPMYCVDRRETVVVSMAWPWLVHSVCFPTIVTKAPSRQNIEKAEYWQCPARRIVTTVRVLGTEAR